MEMYQDLYVWLTEHNNGDLEYAILSDREILYTNKQLESIAIRIDLIEYIRKTT